LPTSCAGDLNATELADMADQQPPRPESLQQRYLRMSAEERQKIMETEDDRVAADPAEIIPDVFDEPDDG